MVSRHRSGHGYKKICCIEGSQSGLHNFLNGRSLETTRTFQRATNPAEQAPRAHQLLWTFCRLYARGPGGANPQTSVALTRTFAFTPPPEKLLRVSRVQCVSESSLRELQSCGDPVWRWENFQKDNHHCCSPPIKDSDSEKNYISGRVKPRLNSLISVLRRGCTKNNGWESLNPNVQSLLLSTWEDLAIITAKGASTKYWIKGLDIYVLTF